jgi:hypothetical protein
MKLGLCIVLSGILHLPFVQAELEPETVTVYMPDARESVGSSMRLEGVSDLEQFLREAEIEAARYNGLIPAGRATPRPPGFHVAGGLHPWVVRQYVLFHTHDIAGCNQVHLMMELDFDILPNGTVGYANGDDCVVPAIRRIVFPHSSETTRVSYPLRYGMVATEAPVLVR